MPENVTLTDADRKIARKLLAVGHADICPYCESRIAATLRASRERERRYEAALKEIVEDCACPCDSHRIAYAALDEEAT